MEGQGAPRLISPVSSVWREPLWESPPGRAGTEAGDTRGRGLIQARAVPASCSFQNLWTWCITFLPPKKEDRAGEFLLDDEAPSPAGGKRSC